MTDFRSYTSGEGAHSRRNSSKAATQQNPAHFPVQGTTSKLPTYPFQPLPTPNGTAPFRYNLSRLLSAGDMATITNAGKLVFHVAGDTGDYRGRQQDFVAGLMIADAEALPDDQKPAFLYHVGDVVYFAGDIDRYGANFYETYKNYPCFIVAIPGNHDCQPDDPQDGPIDPTKKPLDGFVQNFMSTDPTRPGSFKTGAARTQMDLPNVYWTFNTPFATIIGLFSNVGESEGEIRQDQIDWFEGELKAANPNLALIVAVHHPAFSGDAEHSGSSEIERVLSAAFKATGVYPHLVLHGHVHNYQRFTQKLSTNGKDIDISFVVTGNGGYTNLGKLHKVNGKYPTVPLDLEDGLTLEQYDQDNFGFLRIEVDGATIKGTCITAPYAVSGTPEGKAVESFSINIHDHTVTTLA